MSVEGRLSDDDPACGDGLTIAIWPSPYDLAAPPAVLTFGGRLFESSRLSPLLVYRWASPPG
jgi:hypothetical protein